jgi:hypothetical protein
MAILRWSGALAAPLWKRLLVHMRSQYAAIQLEPVHSSARILRCLEAEEFESAEALPLACLIPRYIGMDGRVLFEEIHQRSLVGEVKREVPHKDSYLPLPPFSSLAALAFVGVLPFPIVSSSFSFRPFSTTLETRIP